MIISSTVTKKVLETIVHETFSTFGIFSSSSLLDSLKLLGFYYATNAGISINIEDLKTPDVKKKFIEIANQEIDFVSNQWQQGFVSDVERFQSIIDSWNVATEGLKNRIVDYYQYFDPANNLYIMAFSGARGNMSQVRQLVGMRGLMSDQNGKIIDLPIQRNFREGLSSIDYIVSSYGARKGIVDTALKTADSGYLTRRLIYLAQDLVIREMDCQSKTGIFLFLKKTSSSKNYIGRYLNWAKEETFPYQKIDFKNVFLDSITLDELKRNSPLTLNVRSSLTCKSSASICQLCYGFDLAHNRIISLGETVGILAAQSIGEPGTQLTMRTFHTGGIFTGETIKQILTPFSGKIIFPKFLKTIPYRTNHGVLVSKLQQEAKVKILNWKGIEKEISLSIGSFLYITESCFLPENALIAEYSTQSFSLGTRRMKPVYSTVDGEVNFTMPIQPIPLKKIGINVEEGVIWITFANIFPIPVQAAINFKKRLEKKKSFAYLKIITNERGYVNLSNQSVTIFNKNKKVTLDLTYFLNSFKNCSVKIFPIIKNYQYVDSYTTIAFLYIQPKITEKIYAIRKKRSQRIVYKEIFSSFEKKRKAYKNICKNLVILDEFLKERSQKKKSEKQENKKSEVYPIASMWRERLRKTISKTNNKIKIFLTTLKNWQIRRENEKDENLVFNTFFVISESNILKLNTEQIKSFAFSTNKKSFFRPEMPVNSILSFTHCCYFLKKDGFQLIFQRAIPTHLSANTMLKYKSGDYIYEKDLLAKLVNYTQQTEDIVQGLPKIEELIEARKAKQASILAKLPGVMLNETFLDESEMEIQMPDNIFSYKTEEPKKYRVRVFEENEDDEKDENEEEEENEDLEKEEEEKKIVPILIGCHCFPETFVLFNDKLFLGKLIPPVFAPFELPSNRKKKPKKESKKKGYRYVFKTLGSELDLPFPDIDDPTDLDELKEIQEVRREKKQKRFQKYLRIKGKKAYSKFCSLKLESMPKDIFLYKNKEFIYWKSIMESDLLRARTETGFSEKNLYENSKKDLMVTIGNEEYLFLEPLKFYKDYRLTIRCKPIVKVGDFIDIGEPLTEGTVDTHSLLTLLFEYHSKLDGTMKGTQRSIQKFQLILVNSIQAIYQSQGVNIASKHIEIIVKQMTAKVSIKSGGNTPFLPGELVSFVLISQVSLALEDATMVSGDQFFPYQLPSYEPKILSATNASLTKDSFLSAAGFQETKRVLSKAALEGSCDWLRGLKECIMIGRLIPAGSTFLNYKNYLDKAYYFSK